MQHVQQVFCQTFLFTFVQGFRDLDTELHLSLSALFKESFYLKMLKHPSLNALCTIEAI